MSSISSNSGGSNMSPNANNTQLIAPNMATNMSSGKRWRYYKLSPSKKAIMYGDFSEKIAPVLKNYEKLPHRIELGSVKEIKTIQRYPGMYSSQTLNNASVTLANQVETSSNNSFALYSENSIPLIELHCSSATQAAEWKDGFSMLLDKGFTSKETAEIFHALTEIGVKVKLLQIAGDRVEIPHGAIEVPPVPPGLGSGFFYAIDS
jgi:engulfment/cell motility protein 1